MGTILAIFIADWEVNVKNLIGMLFFIFVNFLNKVAN